MNPKHFLIVLLIAVATVGTIWFTQKNATTPNADRGSTSGFVVGANSIYVADQSPGNTVSVTVVGLEKPGFVVIHEDTQGAPGAVLGASDVLPAGKSENLSPIALSRTTTDGETLYAMIHLDDGDGTFEQGKDTPALDATFGEPVMMIFSVSAEAAEPGAVSL